MAPVAEAKSQASGTGDNNQSQVSTDVVDQSIEKIRERVEELRPSHEEFMKAEKILALIENPPAPTKVASPPASQRDSAAPQRSPSRAGRGSQRLQQFVDAVNETPGKTVAEYARALGISPANYLYRIAGTAESQGLVKKDGTNYVPA